MKRTMGKKSYEKLTHFSCGVCKKWWSVAEAPCVKDKWFCPWCGSEQEFKNT
jgi:hypothetical protein